MRTKKKARKKEKKFHFDSKSLNFLFKLKILKIKKVNKFLEQFDIEIIFFCKTQNCNNESNKNKNQSYVKDSLLIVN